jgi:PAS domain S-box-containing protein
LSAERPGPRIDPERLRALVEAVPLALFEAGPDGQWTYGNARFREVLRLPPGETLEEGITRHLLPADREPVVALWQEAVRTGGPFRADFRVASPLGSARWIRARAAPVRDGKGALRGYAGVLEDVTEEKVREQVLQEEAEKERDRSRRKSEFLAIMSHELRTPIHGVVGTAALLQSTDLSADQREVVDMLVTSADATLSVVNNVLDLSKVEAGRLELHPVDFDLREAVEKSVALFAARAHGKGLDLACRIPAALPTRFRGDPERIRQVLVNLLGNAVKFTEEGEVVLSVSRVDDPRGGPELLRFEVRDTGIGIPPSARERLFEPFSQADPAVAARFGGTGLGLTICRQLVRLLGGVIGVESEPGRGSTFWFTATLEAPRAPGPPPPPPPEALRGRRVLVVDDHAATREAAADLLRSWEVLVAEATGPEDGLEALRRAAAGGAPFDAALLDMHLPGEGTSRRLLGSIRSDGALGGVRVVLATSFGHRARAEAARWDGVSAFLAKPLRRDDLLQGIEAAIAGAPGTPVGRAIHSRVPAISATGSFRIARILVADDNEVSRRIAARQLEQKGFLVESARDGKEAAEAARRTPFDLIFMDWVMPGMDGFEATRAIREQEKGTGWRVPIVAMTAMAMEGDREKCLEPGMDDYVRKPATVEELEAVLERWLAPPLKPRAAAAAPPPPAPAPTPAPGAGDRENPLDESVLDSLAALQGEEDGDIVAELTEIFVKETEPRLERLEGAVAAGDADVLHRESHGLKGTAASIGARRLAQVAKVMEEGGRAGSTEGAEALLRDLREEYARVKAALRARVGRGKEGK